MKQTSRQCITASWTSLFQMSMKDCLSRFAPEDKPRLNASYDAPPFPPHNCNMSTLLCRP
eukprot:9501176-Pyramimonas_sp.AAC.1